MLNRPGKPGRDAERLSSAEGKGTALAEVSSRYLGPRGPRDVCRRRRSPEHKHASTQAQAQSQPCLPPCQATFRGTGARSERADGRRQPITADSDRSVLWIHPPPPPFVPAKSPTFCSARSIPAPARPGNTRVAEVCGRALRKAATQQKAIAASIRLRESPTSMPCIGSKGMGLACQPVIFQSPGAHLFAFGNTATAQLHPNVALSRATLPVKGQLVTPVSKA